MTSGAAESGKAADGQSTNCAKLNRKTAFRCDSEAFPVCATKRGVHPSSKAAAQAVLETPCDRTVHAALDLPPRAGRAELDVVIVQEILADHRQLQHRSRLPGDPHV